MEIIEFKDGVKVISYISFIFFHFHLYFSLYLAGASNGTLVAGTSGVSGTTAYYLSNPTTITFDSSNYM